MAPDKGQPQKAESNAGRDQVVGNATVSHPWLRNYQQGVDWHMQIQVKPLHMLFEDAAREFPNRPYLNFMGRRYTYAQVSDMIDRAAKGFQTHGASPGTKIGLCLPNTPYYVIAYYAALKTGATVVNFNPLYTEEEIARQMADSESDMMVTMDLALTLPKVIAARARVAGPAGSQQIPIIACSMAAALPCVKGVLFRLFRRKDSVNLPKDDRSVIAFSDLIRNDGKPAAVTIDPENDIAVLQYTGGTTGIPKGAMLTHANLYANTVQSASWVTNAQPGRERFIAVLPFFHVFAMTAVLNIGTRWGSEIYLLPKFEVRDLLKVMHKSKATLLAAVPGILNAINECKDIGRYNLRSLKFCITGGAPLPRAVAEKFGKLTGSYTVEGYGLSETSPVATINPVDPAQQRPGSIGKPLPQTVVEIVDPEDKTTVMPVGQRGEVAISGPQIMKGYWKKPGETADVLKNGRVLTGDIGTMDADGNFYIVDRIKDMVIVNGMKIYPREVEDVLYAHPSVMECVVAGVPDPKRGETVVAWLRLKDHSADLTEIQAFLKERLAPYKVPRQIEIRDTLPKTLIGKPDRKALVAEAKAKLAQQTMPLSSPPASGTDASPTP